MEDDDAQPVGWGDLGCIEVRVCRFVQGSKVTTAMINGTGLLKHGPVHERSKKAGSHRVTCVILRLLYLHF